MPSPAAGPPRGGAAGSSHLTRPRTQSARRPQRPSLLAQRRHRRCGPPFHPPERPPAPPPCKRPMLAGRRCDRRTTLPGRPGLGRRPLGTAIGPPADLSTGWPRGGFCWQLRPSYLLQLQQHVGQHAPAPAPLLLHIRAASKALHAFPRCAGGPEILQSRLCGPASGMEPYMLTCRSSQRGPFTAAYRLLQNNDITDTHHSYQTPCPYTSRILIRIRLVLRQCATPVAVESSNNRSIDESSGSQCGGGGRDIG